MASDGPVTTGQDSGGERVALSRVVLLGTIAFLAFFAEGAILDWIAIYVVRVVEATESTGGLVHAVFASAMTLGRLIGDRQAAPWCGAPVPFGREAMVAGGFALILWCQSCR